MDLVRIRHPSYGELGRRGTVIGYGNTGPHADVYAVLTARERHPLSGGPDAPAPAPLNRHANMCTSPATASARMAVTALNSRVLT
ncbi:hypothetical protein ACFRH6_19755 [Streptomyces sp. NPDC056749]|uniref:hypothetical protein n=1 Tax=Streptomyces sp. NPDC056749 TaxID=3345936 RepID=UPI0036CA99F2